MRADWLAIVRQMGAVIRPGRARGPDLPLGYQAPMTLEEQQRWSRLLDRLRVIDPQTAMILSLRFEEGLTHEQTAERLRLQTSQVRVKEQAAIAWLRRQ